MHRPFYPAHSPARLCELIAWDTYISQFVFAALIEGLILCPQMRLFLHLKPNADSIVLRLCRDRAEADCVASPARLGRPLSREDTMRTSGSSIVAAAGPTVDDEPAPLLAVNAKKESRARQVQSLLACTCSALWQVSSKWPRYWCTRLQTCAKQLRG